MSLESYPNSKNWRRAVIAGLALIVILLASTWLVPFNRSASAKIEPQQSDSSPATQNAEHSSAAITIDYPQNGSIFPPGITPPTFIWRDSAATSWQIAVSFADKAPALHARSSGVRMHIGAIDPQCVAPSNKLPKL
ncbi:MAG TPA: hypothetical protein VMW15_10020, partial [Terracidiphilus sp.]|nr:hypothetical protein [Terracidiphilus sp.]